MAEDEIGAMVKRIFAMAENRHSDYAIGKATLEIFEMAMDIVIHRQLTNPDGHAVASEEPLL